MSRFAWCETPLRAVNTHAACRRTYTSNGREHVCECPCHEGQTGANCETMGANKTAPRRCANTVGPRGLAELDRSSTSG